MPKPATGLWTRKGFSNSQIRPIHCIFRRIQAKRPNCLYAIFELLSRRPKCNARLQKAVRCDLQKGSNERVVGARGFEPPTPWSRTRCATRLRYAPKLFAEESRKEGALTGWSRRLGSACWARAFDSVEFSRDCGGVWGGVHLIGRRMMERRQIVKLWRRERGADVLATLVRVEGSSYRRAGGATAGGAGRPCGDGPRREPLAAGAWKADVIRRAGWMARAGAAAVERYATSFDDTAEIPFGLGCGGTVDLLFEPVATAEGEALLRAMEASLEGQRGDGGELSSRRRDAALRRVVFDASGEVVFRE